MTLNPSEFRKAMGSFATGVTIITVDLDGEVHGMTANAFASVSLDPLLVLVCVDSSTRTHEHLHSRKRFGINVLSADQRAISEYYARPDRTHEHAETEVGALVKKLRDSGFLTRDGRMKERKKYGRKGARKSFQFSKR